jgi:hypothetical protein
MGLCFFTLTGLALPLWAQSAEAQSADNFETQKARALAEGRWEDRLLIMREEALNLAAADQSEAGRRVIKEAIDLAQELVAHDLMPVLLEASAECEWASGETAQALTQMNRVGTLALATQPVQWELAERAWAQLSDWQKNLGQAEVAAQTDAWLQRVIARDATMLTLADLQPRVMKIAVPSGMPAHTRLSLNNTRLRRVTGRLWVESSSVTLSSWQTTAEGCALQGTLAPASAARPTEEVRQLSLRPREQKFIEITVAAPARAVGQAAQLTVCWEVGGVIQRSTVDIVFSPQLPEKQATHSSLAERSPYLAVPVYEEIQHQTPQRERQENFRVTVNQPSRVEVYELRRQGASTERWPLAIDAEGDGRYDGWGDSLYVDEDHDGYPDVFFSADQSRVALEFLLYPASSSAGTVDVEVQLREDRRTWRPVPDAVHRLQSEPVVKP